MSSPADLGTVEIKPEVVFLYEILGEFGRQQIQIPRFQRAFVWRTDQMTDLLDSINKQYPVGSLLVWETDEKIATLDRLGPFVARKAPQGSIGYLLDGHQRLMTLASALLRGSDALQRADVEDSQWDMFWNVRNRRFQHRTASDTSELLFPMTSLLDTMRFLEEVENLRDRAGGEGRRFIKEISSLARTFQSYRVPVIRLRQTGLTEAVEIFARLNSKGQAMSADQMVSALTFRQSGDHVAMDLSSDIDRLTEGLGERGFGEVDRGTILRAILANLDEDIYKTDWTRLARDRRESIQDRMSGAVEPTRRSLSLALDFLEGLGVETIRLLPYGLQLVLLSAFFNAAPRPSDQQRLVLERWFWVSSFSAWFGGANPSRIGALIKEFRGSFAADPSASELESFDLRASALPFPTNFDMRSARTRALLLVMLAAPPREGGHDYSVFARELLASRGPGAVGQIFWELPRELRGNPANRLFRAPSASSGALASWVVNLAAEADWPALDSIAIDKGAVSALEQGDVRDFIERRMARMIVLESEFQRRVGVTPSDRRVAAAPIDTE